MITGSLIADFLLLAILATLAGFVYTQKRINRFFVFDPMMFFWIGALVVYVLEAVSGYDFYVERFGESVVHMTLFWVWVGILFLQLGYSLPVGARLANALPEAPARLDPMLMALGAIVLIILGLVGWYLQIMTAGSFAAWGAVSRGGENWEELSGYVTLLASFLAVGISVLVLHVEMHQRGTALKIVAWVLLACLLILFLYIGSRSRTIATVVVALMAWSLSRRKNPTMTLLVPLFVGLFVVTSFQAEYRSNFKNFSFNLDQVDWTEVPGKILPGFISGDDSRKTYTTGSEFGVTVATVQLVPKQISFNYGYEFLQIFTHPIPRSIWKDKRYPRGETWSQIHLIAGTSSHWVDYVKVPYLGGPSPAYIASWYFIGGAIGLLIGGLLTGILLRTIRGVYDRSRGNEGFLVLYLILAPIGFSEASSHPFNWVFGLPLLLVPLILLMRLIKIKRKAPVYKLHHY